MEEFIVLSAAAFTTAVVSGTLGMGGGILLLVIMASYMPALVLIPSHGLVQLGSNIFRTLLHFEHLKRPIVLLYFVGGLVGAIIGSQIVIQIPDSYFKMTIACFILIVTWMPKFKSAPQVKGKFFFLGLIATFVALVVGATGPLLAPFFLREGLTKHQLVATKAGCQIFTHLLKLIVYFLIGINLVQYWKLISVMIILTFFGNWCGKFFLHRLPEKSFFWLFRAIITILAARMLWLSF